MRIELVANKYKKEDRDPSKIWSNIDMDELRRTQCLCLNCDRKNDLPPYASCPVANEIYQIILKNHLAIAMTRCGATDEDGNLLYKPLKN